MPIAAPEFETVDYCAYRIIFIIYLDILRNTDIQTMERRKSLITWQSNYRISKNYGKFFPHSKCLTLSLNMTSLTKITLDCDGDWTFIQKNMCGPFDEGRFSYLKIDRKNRQRFINELWKYFEVKLFIGFGQFLECFRIRNKTDFQQVDLKLNFIWMEIDRNFRIRRIDKTRKKRFADKKKWNFKWDIRNDEAHFCI